MVVEIYVDSVLVPERLSPPTHYPHSCYFIIKPKFMCQFQNVTAKNEVRNGEFDCIDCKYAYFLTQKWSKMWMAIMGRPGSSFRYQ